jgi:hypothetical protein
MMDVGPFVPVMPQGTLRPICYDII